MKLRRSFYPFIGGAIAASVITAVFLAPRTEFSTVGSDKPDGGRLPVLAEIPQPARTGPSETNLEAVERTAAAIGGDGLVPDPLGQDTAFGSGSPMSAVQRSRGAPGSVIGENHRDDGVRLEGAATSIAEPECWQLTSNLPESFYTVTQDNEQVFSGESSARIESTSSRAQFVTLSQTINASAFAGKRIEFSAFLRLEDVDRGVSLWVLATDAAGGITVSRRLDWIPGSLDWHSRSIVVDVPPASVALTYAFNILGEGRLWVDDARIAALDAKAADPGASAPSGRRGSLLAPAVASLPASSFNTDFEVWDSSSGQQRPCA